jgi:hypothetical protein
LKVDFKTNVFVDRRAGRAQHEGNPSYHKGGDPMRKAKKAVKKVRCAGMTREGKKCSIMVAPPAKKCHLHKGK